MTRPPAAFLAAIAPTLRAATPGPLGVAVSGGGDSLALLLLLRAAGIPDLAAVTVDHGLRPESAAEAAGVAALCAARGIPHAVLRWTGWSKRGNLQAAARQARRQLIAAWARGRGVEAVALGHTLDDQAETFLMRLARGSGIDGLSAMRACVRAEGLLWLRPMLGLRRADLRVWLASEGIPWAEDPGNENAAFQRVRVRQSLEPLARLGLDAPRLAATAAAMARAREALEAATHDLARAASTTGPAGDLRLDPERLAAAPLEIRLRLLAAALCWVSGAPYRPRLSSLELALAAVEHGLPAGGLSLHGCLLRPGRGGKIGICREPAAVAARVPLTAGRWDGRWAWNPDDLANSGATEIGALGDEGLALLADRRAAGLPAMLLATTPALWRGPGLLAAPFAARGAPGPFRRVSTLPSPW
ncbi:MAG: tRNA lysidine(34) synthetase TilS [Amaricoccus sp.]